MALTRFRLTLFVAFSLGVLFSFDPIRAVAKEPLLINQIAIDPHDPRILYAAARPQGVLKSTDRGMSWRPARIGLTNTSAYHIVIHPANPKILYLGTFGGGIYKSVNGGESWAEANQGLGNTNIHALTINPLQPDQLIVSTSTGELFKSDNGGKGWAPFNEGLPFFPGEVIAKLFILPNDPGGVYLAQDGFFSRPFSSSTWQAVDNSLQKEAITAAAYEPKDRILYAGTMKQGLYTTKLESNPISAPHLAWTPVAGPFQMQWIRLIVPASSDAAVIYVAAIGQGLFKTTDHGKSWREINDGLPNKDVESLAMDPDDPERLYVGMHNDGLFISTDGGSRWNPPAKFEVEPVKQIIASLSGQTPSTQSRETPVAIPPPFSKCNKCHGWTDSALNQKTTYWRVSANRRDWRPTVHRMSPGAGLTPQEEDEIIKFLTDYNQQRSKTP
jgi:photosystem II stability/assembly factor-like uncharacterized protein